MFKSGVKVLYKYILIDFYITLNQIRSDLNNKLSHLLQQSTQKIYNRCYKGIMLYITFNFRQRIENYCGTAY